VHGDKVLAKREEENLLWAGGLVRQRGDPRIYSCDFFLRDGSGHCFGGNWAGDHYGKSGKKE